MAESEQLLHRTMEQIAAIRGKDPEAFWRVSYIRDEIKHICYGTPLGFNMPRDVRRPFLLACGVMPTVSKMSNEKRRSQVQYFDTFRIKIKEYVQAGVITQEMADRINELMFKNFPRYYDYKHKKVTGD